MYICSPFTGLLCMIMSSFSFDSNVITFDLKIVNRTKRNKTEKIKQNLKEQLIIVKFLNKKIDDISTLNADKTYFLNSKKT